MYICTHVSAPPPFAAGAELNPSDTFSSGLAMRFPRIITIRSGANAKPLMDCERLTSLKQLAARNNGKLALPSGQRDSKHRRGGEGGDDGEYIVGGKARAGRDGSGRGQPPAVILSHHQHADTGAVRVVVDVFHAVEGEELLASLSSSSGAAEGAGTMMGLEEKDENGGDKAPVQVVVLPQDYERLLRAPGEVVMSVAAASGSEDAAAGASNIADGAGVGRSSAGGSDSQGSSVKIVEDDDGWSAALFDDDPTHSQPSEGASSAAIIGSSAAGNQAQAWRLPLPLLSQFTHSAAAGSFSDPMTRFVPPEYRSRRALEVLVKRLGGTPVALREKGTKYVVAADADNDLRVRAWLQKGELDLVIHPCWLVECLQERRRLPFLPRHLVHASPAVKEWMKETVDPETGDEHDQLLTSDAEAAALLSRAAGLVDSSAFSSLLEPANVAAGGARNSSASAMAAASALLNEAAGDLEPEEASLL